MGKMEDNMKRLEEITALLNQENIDFDQSVALYQEGMALIGECKQRIEQAEQKIEEIKPC